MDELSNKQMVLLTMFTSFVVSIGTGIITVAMLEEAPPTLTQTVNRVVERTIERVVTGTTTQKIVQVPVTTIVKEQTQYQSEDDMVVSAVEKNQKHVVAIWTSAIATTSDPVDTGVLISRDGVIAVDAGRFFVDDPKSVTYPVRIGDQFYVAEYIAKTSNDITSPIAFLKVKNAPEGMIFEPVAFRSGAGPKLGQSIVVIGGRGGAGVFKTNLSKFRYAESRSTSTLPVISGMETLPKIPKESEGGLAVNLDGQVVGIIIANSSISELNTYMVYPASLLFDLVGATPASTPDKAHSQNSGETPAVGGA